MLLRHQPELVITSVGSPAPVLAPLHDAGALVFADVASIRHAERAVAAGADGLVLLTAGAGGQTGWLNPFVFVRAVRGFFDGPIVLAGGISDGHALRAAQRRSAATSPTWAPSSSRRARAWRTRGYKQMLVDAHRRRHPAHDGLHRLADQHAAALDRGRRSRSRRPAGARRDRHRQGHRHRRPRKPPRRWRDIWSGGHSTSGVTGVLAVDDLVARTIAEYEARERAGEAGLGRARKDPPGPQAPHRVGGVSSRSDLTRH